MEGILAKSTEFEGETLTGTGTPKQIAQVLQHIQASMRKRFGDMDEGILEATKIADFTNWPTSAEDAEGTLLLIQSDIGGHKYLVFCRHLAI